MDRAFLIGTVTKKGIDSIIKSVHSRLLNLAHQSVVYYHCLFNHELNIIEAMENKVNFFLKIYKQSEYNYKHITIHMMQYNLICP